MVSRRWPAIAHNIIFKLNYWSNYLWYSLQNITFFDCRNSDGPEGMVQKFEQLSFLPIRAWASRTAQFTTTLAMGPRLSLGRSIQKQERSLAKSIIVIAQQNFASFSTKLTPPYRNLWMFISFLITTAPISRLWSNAGLWSGLVSICILRRPELPGSTW